MSEVMPPEAPPQLPVPYRYLEVIFLHAASEKGSADDFSVGTTCRVAALLQRTPASASDKGAGHPGAGRDGCFSVQALGH